MNILKIIAILGLICLTGCRERKFEQHYLLVVTPVTEEYLGTIEARQTWNGLEMVFVDCIGHEHRIKSGTIETTQDTCE